jgi:hypothetical protein
VFPAGYPADDWRLVFHNGRWWFWTPRESWLYFDRGRWSDFRGGPVARRERFDGRYGVGFRGDNERWKDDSEFDRRDMREDRRGDIRGDINDARPGGEASRNDPNLMQPSTQTPSGSVPNSSAPPTSPANTPTDTQGSQNAVND